MRARWLDSVLEDRLWDRMPPVGREFGSPDFDRLMEENFQAGVGVFAPEIRQTYVTRDRSVTELKGLFGKPVAVVSIEDMNPAVAAPKRRPHDG